MKNKQTNVIDINFEREIKKAHFKAKVRDVANKTKNWIVDHEELIVVALPIVIGGASKMVTTATKRSNLRKQEMIKNRYCYDPSLGHYWHLKRNLSNTEWVQIDRRKANGERLADILSDMKVLK